MLDGGAWIDRMQAVEACDDGACSDGLWFRLGDLCLQLGPSRGAFVDGFAAQWADCVVTGPAAALRTIRCTARLLEAPSLLVLSFAGSDLPDPLDASATPVRMLRHLGHFALHSGPAPGWRMLVDRDVSRRMLAAGNSSRLVVALDEAPPDFAADALIAVVQGAQPQLQFMHAASFGIGGVGALLIGAGQAGKSTTVLALGARGHTIFGDDVAAIRLRGCELLPFRKRLSLRPGRYVASLDSRLRSVPQARVVDPSGIERTLVRISALFATAPPESLPLRFAFVLDGFAAQPQLMPFRPDAGALKQLRGVVSESVPAWGLSPGRDLMKFLNVADVLSKLACHRVRLGTPEASAAAIESMMEATCIST